MRVDNSATPDFHFPVQLGLRRSLGATHALTRFRPLGWAALLAGGLLLVGCGQSHGDGSGAAGAAAPPPTPVGVYTMQAATVSLTAELPGRLEAFRVAQVRARVTGIVKKRLFTEGALVGAGQSLFEVDAASYQATLEGALATQARAEAALAQAQANLERNRPLVQAKAISDQDWLASQVAQQQAQADVAQAKAAVQQAKLNVDYAAVRSPIGGRIGRAQVSEGALVNQSEATLLATVQQVDKLYVNFTQSATELMQLRRNIEAGRLSGAGSTQVRVVLDDGSDYPLAGQLLFQDLTVDATSGQVTLRAELPNPKGDLLPGLFVRVRLEQARSDKAMLVPQQAVARAATGDTVMVVGSQDHVVAVRPIKLGRAQGNQWVVLSGLEPGEQVVVDGLQKLRPQATVAPVPWPAASAPALAASSASAAASR